MSEPPRTPVRSTWELVEAMVADEERAIDGMSREELIARYVEAGVERAEVEAHVDEIIREREARRREDPGPAIAESLTTAELDAELRTAGIEPESLRRIARQVFAQFGIEESASTAALPTAEDERDPEAR